MKNRNLFHIVLETKCHLNYGIRVIQNLPHKQCLRKTVSSHGERSRHFSWVCFIRMLIQALSPLSNQCPKVPPLWYHVMALQIKELAALPGYKVKMPHHERKEVS